MNPGFPGLAIARRSRAGASPAGEPAGNGYLVQECPPTPPTAAPFSQPWPQPSSTEVSSPERLQHRPVDLRRRRLTLAPVSSEVCSPSPPLPYSSLASGSDPEVLSLNQGLPSSVHCAPEDAAYHECLMAGYTSEEARILINNLDQLTEDSTDQSHMVENF